MVFYHLIFYQIHKPCLILDIVFPMSVCAFNSLPKGEYLNLLIVAAFSNKSFSGKTFLLVESSYLPTFTDDKTEVLATYLSKSCWALFCSILLLIVKFSLLKNNPVTMKF